MKRPAILDRLRGVQRAGEGWLAFCPAHDDRHKQSLSVGVGDDGRTLLKCHALACTVERITQAVDMTLADLGPETGNDQQPQRDHKGRVTRFEIRNAAAELVAVHAREDRTDGKVVWWEGPDGARGLGGRKVVDLPLYRVEQLAGGGPVVVVEGEPATDALATRGIPAVGTVTGASATPSDASLEPLLGCRAIVLWRDHDAPGEEHMRRIGARLRALGHDNVRELRWLGARDKDDAADFFARGGTVEACQAMIANAAPFADSGDGTVTAAPELRREGFDLVLTWPDGVAFALTGIRDSRDGVRGELTVTQDHRRLSWGSFSLSSTTVRETLRKKLETTAPGPPWGVRLEEAAWRLTQAAREGEPLVTLTGTVTSAARALLPRVLYEGEATSVFGDGDTGKSLFALALAAAVQSGVALPFGLVPARAVTVAYLDWETSRDTAEERLGLLAAGLGVDPPPILYKRMTRPLVDEATALAADFTHRQVGLVIVDSKMFAVAGGDGAAFHEPITAFYNALRLFAPAASLVLNHITGADARGGGPARPFGGAFAFNGPRLIWEARRDTDVTDATAIAFTCTKANNLPRKPEPFGLRFVPGAGTITVYPFDLKEAAPRALASTPLSYRIRLALATGDRTSKELAEYLGASEESVSRKARELKSKGILDQTNDQIGRGQQATWRLSTL